jgi:hypothetical protein
VRWQKNLVEDKKRELYKCNKCQRIRNFQKRRDANNSDVAEEESAMMLKGQL